tara:strand:- start:44 stop:343 length:300 start_codon:yes stop_codon:yes gene_type:complete
MKRFVTVLILVVLLAGLVGCIGEDDSDQKIGGVSQERFDSCMRYGMDSHPDCKKFVEWFCSTVKPRSSYKDGAPAGSPEFYEWFKEASACERMRQEAGY